MKDGELLALPAFPDTYDGPSFPTFIQQCAFQPRYIDAVAMASADKNSIRVSVLNRHPTADWDADIQVGTPGFKLDKVRVTEVYSDDLDAANTFENPDVVVPVTTEYSANEWAAGKHVVRKHSWQFIEFEGAAQ